LQLPEGGWHLYVLRLNEGSFYLKGHALREAFRECMLNMGVQTSVHYPPLHLMSRWYDGTQLPVTEREHARMLSLPIYPDMSLGQIEIVTESVKKSVFALLKT
jgi:UDP-4-amino-4-deoxy-L-arabinose-oxoglutarate aminotransferase